MATVTVSIENLVGTVNAGLNVASATEGKDDFQALLDIGSPDKEFGEDELTKNERKPAKPRDVKNNDPVAVAVEVPTALFVTKQPEALETEEVPKSPDIAIKPKEAFEEPVASSGKEKPALPPQAAAVPQADKANIQPPVDKNTIAEPTVSISAIADPAPLAFDLATKPDESFFGQLHSQMNQLHKTLSELIRGLIHRFQLQQEVNPGIDPLTASDDQLAALAKALSSNATDPATAYTGLYDLLKHMRDTFAKLQNVVQGMSPSTDLQTQFNSQTQALSYLDMLEADLELLPKYLPPQPTPVSVSENDNGAITDLMNRALKYVASLKELLSSVKQPPVTDSLLSATAQKDDKIIPFKAVSPAEILPKTEVPQINPVLTKIAEPLKEMSADAVLSAKDLPKPIMQSSAVPAPAVVVDINTGMPAGNSNPVTMNAQAAVLAAAAQNGASADTGTGNGNNSGGNNNPVPTILATGATGAGASAGSTTGASFARMLNQTQPVPVTEQVTFHIKTALADGSSKIRIQLEPAELGKLEIKLHVTADGKTGMVVTADNRDTLNLLQRDSRGLEQALIDAGLKPDSNSLSFNLRGGQQEQGEFGQAAANYQKNAEDEEEIMLDDIHRSYVINLSEGLDIKI